MFKIQFVEGEKWLNQSDSLTIIQQQINPSRGNIYSDNGSLLATSMPIYEVAFDPMVVDKDTFYTHLSELCRRLSELFPETTAKQFRTSFEQARRNERSYVRIRNRVNYNELKELKQFPIFRLGRYRGGLISSLTTKRVHPAGQLAFRTVGYYTEDNPGVGLERSYTEDLGGSQGMRLVQKISGAYKPINDENLIEPQNGRDVHTTINVDFQEVTHMALSKAILKHDADHGCAVVMEIATGKIKAISNLQNKGEGKLVENYNYAVGESYEPGSIFKVFSAMAALEDDLMDPNDSMDILYGEREYFGKPMRDSDKGRHKYLNFKKAFALSSNVFFSSLIFDNYANNPGDYLQHLRRLELHKKTGIDIIGEGEPFLNQPDSRTWSQLTLPWLAIGYENQHTPLQVLTAYNGVINDGKLMRPYLVEEITDAGLVVKSFNPVMAGEVCSPETSKIIREFTQETVEHGTASNIRSSVVSMAGKTGTAQIASSKGYQKFRQYNASYIGHFPADKPVYSVIVMINRPSNGVFYASYVAAPVFKEIAEKVYTISVLRDVEPKDSGFYPSPMKGYYADLKTIGKSLDFPFSDKEHSALVAYDPKNGLVQKTAVGVGAMPDVKGMGLRDALFILEGQGLKVKYRGTGHVKNQFPEKGARLSEGQTVYINLAL
ncbi:transpeptidase family protein [bacterium]|nr:transpeptidase family protein [bacterium]